MGISDPNVMFKGPGPLLSNNFIETKSYYSTLSTGPSLPPLKNDNFSLSLSLLYGKQNTALLLIAFFQILSHFMHCEKISRVSQGTFPDEKCCVQKCRVTDALPAFY